MSTATFATRSTESAIEKYKIFCASGHGYIGNEGLEKITRGFSVTPAVAQTLNTKVQEANPFLAKINILPVRDLNGENILLGHGGPCSSRTDTKAKRREPLVSPELEAFTYQLHKINTDVVFTYQQVDSWARFSDFTKRFQQVTLHRMGLDRVMCGWYGESASKETSITNSPQLQDLAPGWMQYMREKLPANILAEGATAGEIRFGTGGDYETLDMAVSDLVGGIEEKGLDTSDLVCLVGRELMQAERNRIFGQGNSLSPEQKIIYEGARVTFSGIPVEVAPQLPPRALIITPLKNLSIYHQEDSYRRVIKDEPEFDRAVDYTSRNEGYVVEEPRLFIGVEFKNVKLPTGDGGWS